MQGLKTQNNKKVTICNTALKGDDRNQSENERYNLIFEMGQRQDLNGEKCFRETSRKTLCKRKIKEPKGKIQ